MSFEATARNSAVETNCGNGWRIRFEILDESDSVSALPWAFAEISSEDLVRRRTWSLLLSHPDSSEAVYGTTRPDFVRQPAFLRLQITPGDARTPMQVSRTEVGRQSVTSTFSSSYSIPSVQKRVMLVTRGTRGDVQPFVALAQGLASKPYCCEVFIVTELRWKDFVKKNTNGLPIHFRPSGGDTTKKVKQYAAQKTMHLGQHSEMLQALMLSRSEVEFFPSEGCFHYWANLIRPDFIVYGFPLIHVAMILSETLQIPIVGFILQPSREIEPRSLSANMLDELMVPIRSVITGPAFQAFLQQVMERIPSGDTLNALRTSRGLVPCPRDIDTCNRQLVELRRLGVPSIVPMSPVVISQAQAAEMRNDSMILSNFIFLHEEVTPAAQSLTVKVKGFIENARSLQRNLVGMTFSSMPVGREKMFSIADVICSARADVACIVLAAGQPEGPAATTEVLECRQQLISEGRLLVVDGPVPFDQLFPMLDAVVLHGGLGVTSEALRAGLPIITSGILLMDQRYWAKRVFDLGAGSKGIPVDYLATQIGQLLEAALPPMHGAISGNSLDKKGVWRENAASIQQLLRTGCLGDEDGIACNAKAVFEAGTQLEFVAGEQTFRGSVIVNGAYHRPRCCVFGLCRQWTCLLRFLRQLLSWLLCMQLTSCFVVWLKCARLCLCCPYQLCLFLRPNRSLSRLAGRRNSRADRDVSFLNDDVSNEEPDAV